MSPHSISPTTVDREFRFELFGIQHTAADLAAASARFSAARDRSGRGASTMPLPAIYADGEIVGHFSYNGRIWRKPSSQWAPGDVPVYPAMEGGR
jgi:hypothetical protein